MDAHDHRIQDEIQLARVELIRAGIPEGPYICDCGGPFIRKDQPWTTAHRLKVKARCDLDVSSACISLALHELVDEGVFIQRPKDLLLRLRLVHPTVRRSVAENDSLNALAQQIAHARKTAL